MAQFHEPSDRCKPATDRGHPFPLLLTFRRLLAKAFHGQLQRFRCAPRREMLTV